MYTNMYMYIAFLKPRSIFSFTRVARFQMYPVDYECISTMISFEHLNLMCHGKTVPTPPSRK